MSIILGVLVSALPNYIAKTIYFRFGKQSPHKILNWFYTSLLCKYFLTVLLAGVLLLWPGLQVLPFCMGMLLAEAIRWVWLLFSLRVRSI